MQETTVEKLNIILKTASDKKYRNIRDELKKITINLGFFTIATKPAGKFLSDGRNAHLIQKPASWWLPMMCSRFDIEFLQNIPLGFLLIVKAKNI